MDAAGSVEQRSKAAIHAGERGSHTQQELEDVRAFRQRAIANGYTLVRVRTHMKSPLARAWQHGEDCNELFDVRPNALNTGLVLGGLRCIDVDVDEPQLVSTILEKMRVHLPAGALVRRRANSPRMAVLFRAAEGQPPIESIKGPKGKIEVLGAGQQVLVHGVHPSRASYTWTDGLGPDTVKCDDLPAVSEEKIQSFLIACAPLVGADTVRLTGVSLLALEPADPGSVLPIAKNLGTLHLSNDLGAGIEVPNWFELQTADEKRALVEACLQALDNRTADPRDIWLRVLFALGDAERLGCLDARQLALEWSRKGASWTSEADFNTAWDSDKPKSSGVTVGTLLAMARGAGLDLSSWRDRVLARSQSAGAQSAASISSPQPKSVRALSITSLPCVPPKRRWLHGTDLIRGAVSLLVAPGGRGKSSWLVTLALACASGRSLLEAHVFGGPLRVLLISAEDPVAEVALRIRAAMRYHGLTDFDVSGLRVIGADRWGLPLLETTAGGPMLNKPGWDALIVELDDHEPDILIVDPLISVMGGVSQNDNAAAALLMSRLVGLAAERGTAVMVAHHASKGRDATSAESAMGAASFVNLSRIALGIEPLALSDAGKLGLPPWEAHGVFRVVGTKLNLSAPSDTDRWFRLISVEMDNAEPPTYRNGDKVAVVEVFQPGVSGATFPSDMVRDALRAIDGATTPLSPSKRSTHRYAGPEIEKAIAPHRGGRSSETEAKAMLDHLKRNGLVKVDKVNVPRPGKGCDKRDGLVLTPAGKHALQNQSPQSPQPPATSMRHDAGGAPLGPRIAQGGMGEMRRSTVTEARSASSSTGATGLPVPQAETTKVESEAQTTAPSPSGIASEVPSAPASRSSSTAGRSSASKAVASSPALTSDDLAIPDFLDRRKADSTKNSQISKTAPKHKGKKVYGDE